MRFKKCYFLITFSLVFYALSSLAQLGWVQVPSPNPSNSRNMIRGISGTSSADVWAVGSYEELFPYNPYNVQHDLILHWNGSGWQQFPAMHLSETLDDLWDVEALSPNNVWAVGAYNEYATTRAELLHFDGNTWTNQPLPFITGGSWLNALHAVSATDIWAAGGKSGSPNRPPYVIHYNGNEWTEIPVSTNLFRSYFNDIHGTTNDMWAVGHWGNAYGDFHALVMHWDGSSWTQVGLPANIVTPLSELLSVKMVAPNDVWATGYFLSGGGFNIHWDGISWTEITPFAGGGTFAAVNANHIFSVGGEIAHWNGNTWTVVDSLQQLSYPSLVSTVVFSNGEIWAGGRTVDTSNRFFSLIYRSVNNTPLFTGGTSQSWNVAANSTHNALGNLMETADADQGQVLNYTVVQAPANGVLSGFPATAITSNGYAIPLGLAYTPLPGFTGGDQFTIRVAAGQVTSETTIYVDVFGVVPLSFLNFRVTRQGSKALLEWTTVNEINASHFLVEHSKEDMQYSVKGNKPAKGNGNASCSYRFVHHSPVTGMNYYRISLVNADGSTTVYPVRSLQFDKDMLPAFVMLTHSLTRQTIRYQLNETGSFQINMYNMQGQKLLQENILNNIAGSNYLLGLPAVHPGIYVVEVYHNQQRFAFKLGLY